MLFCPLMKVQNQAYHRAAPWAACSSCTQTQCTVKLQSSVRRKYRVLTPPGALNQRLTALRGKPVRLEISMIVNLSRIFIRLTLHNISMVIISLSCLIVKQAIEHRGLHPRLVKQQQRWLPKFIEDLIHCLRLAASQATYSAIKSALATLDDRASNP